MNRSTYGPGNLLTVAGHVVGWRTMEKCTMNTPVQTIGRGLDAVERAKNSPGTFRLAALAAAPSTIAEISEITVKASKARDRLHKMRAASISAVQDHREKIVAEYAELGMVENENGRGRLDTLGASKRKGMIDGAITKFRKTLNEATASERAKFLTEQKAAKATLDLVRSAWNSPEAILMLNTLGSEKRSACTRDLERAGATELTNAMRRAVQTGNKDLAAACCVRLDSIGKESRKLIPFSKTDIAGAEAVAGADFAKAQEAFGFADLAFEQSKLAEQEITGKPLTSKQKIHIGLLKHELETKIGRKLDADGHVTDADGNRTGETLEQKLDRKFPGGPLPAGYEFVDVGD